MNSLLERILRRFHRSGIEGELDEELRFHVERRSEELLREAAQAGAELTPEEAWDVAAYMISQPRPSKPRLDRDFPDLLNKPVDTPYGPYADGFSEQQHKYGPFAPIRDVIKRLKAERPPATPSAR